ncbi:GNAT family N-acetyltransferase [Jeotgalibacillus proteolyticus]|uniref:GNAT family N-acetyltransferase n=1 Tax=Jeotgalibacillus proteolyticus TaxID=2082395 RepID=A0A2S5GFE9_9BACL|nr:GNAT family N-acetyltransferase [Jeotgalibacillus proteolyticus]PPA71726.1 GNAT family N-acetyltransferase [Jeotgalibacillus proteolyticus]
MEVQLKRVTEENKEEVVKLHGKEEQRDCTRTVAESLEKIETKSEEDHSEYIPFAIYDDETVVGFMLYTYEDETTNNYWIEGMIIDEKYQGKGYGRAGLKKLIDWISENFRNCSEIRAAVSTDNESAYELYKNFGFVPSGEMKGEESILYLVVQTASD